MASITAKHVALGDSHPSSPSLSHMDDARRTNYTLQEVYIHFTHFSLQFYNSFSRRFYPKRRTIESIDEALYHVFEVLSLF